MSDARRSPDTGRMRMRRPEAVAIIAVTVVFALVLLVWAYLTPALHGPDELANVDAAFQLAMGRAWPAAGKLHYLQGLLAQNVPATLPPAAQRLSVAQLVGDGSLNALVNPMSQHPPTYFLAQALVAHLLGFAGRRWDLVVLGMRLADVLVMLPVPALVWAAVRRATRSPRISITAAAAVLAVPQLAQLGASVSVWVPVVTAGLAATWLAIRILTGDRAWWTVIALGAALGIGVAVMSGGFMAVPFTILAVLAARGAAPIGSRALRAVVVAAIPVAASCWWFVADIVRVGTPQPDAYPAVHMAWPKFESPAPTQFAGALWDGLSTSFWGELGRYEWPLSPIFVESFTVVALAVVVWASTMRHADRRTMLVAGIFPCTALVVVVLRDWATYASHLGVTVNQGRFLFPALGTLLVVQALAWRSLVVSPSTRVKLGRAALIVAPVTMVAALGLVAANAFSGLRSLATSAGLRLVASELPKGIMPLAALVVLTAVAGIAAFVILWRWLGAGTPTSTADVEPLNSEPTFVPTQRNNP